MNKALIEVFQLFGSYKLKQASNAKAIAEREYASAAEIKFTAFTSCIGVIAKEGSTLTAVHLSILDAKDHKFCTTDAARVIGLLPKKPDKVKVVGCISTWEKQDELMAAFQKLTGSLKDLEKDERGSGGGDGTYGATIERDEIKVSWAP